MSTCLRTLIFLAFCTNIYAQTAVRDSLQSVLPSLQGKERIQTLVALAQNYETGNPDSAISLAQEGLVLSRHMKDAENIALCLHRVAAAYRMKGEYKEVEEYSFKSLQISKVIGNKKLIAANLNTIGVACVGRGMYTKALEYYLQALKTREEVHDWMGVATTLGNIGIVHTHQGNYQKASNCYTQALKILQALPDTRHNIAIMLDNLAYLYKAQGHYQKALSVYQEIYDTFLQMDDKTGMTTCLLNTADIYYLGRDFEKALDYYSQGLVLAQELETKDVVAQSYMGIARIYTETNKVNEALALADKALVLAKQSGAKQLIKEASLLLYQRHKERKDFDKALYYFEQAHQVNDSIMQVESAKMSFALQANYDLEKKHMQMASLNHVTQQTLNKYSQQKYLFIGVVIAFGLIVYLLVRNVQQEKKIDQLLVKQKMSELAYLNAHKIRGPVASILGLLNLYNRNNLADDFNQVVITHIDTSAKELDRMIHEVANKTQLMYQMHEHEE